MKKNILQAIQFYRSTMVELDMDTAMDCLIFVSAHFAINTQIYCVISKTETLCQLSSSLTEEIDQSQFQPISSFRILSFSIQFFLGKRVGSDQFYLKMENLYFILRTWFFILLIISTSVMMAPALFLTFRNIWINDEMAPNMWILSIKVS